MIELAFAVHHAHLPVALVRVADLLGCGDEAPSGDLLRPHELTVTIELAEVKVAAVLTAIWVHEMAISMARVRPRHRVRAEAPSGAAGVPRLPGRHAWRHRAQ